MKPIEVEEFLDVNGWKVDPSSKLWRHTSILDPLYSFFKNEIIINPDDCFDLAIQYMTISKIIIKDTIASLYHKGKQLIRTSVQPTITFSSGGLQVFTDYTNTGFCITPKCDCGAVKCKTTHSHWCSTMKGNQNGR